MKKCFGHIAAVAVSALLFFVSCKDGVDVIPRDTLAKIYAEMLVTDQWIMTTPNVRSIADTSLVYEPILEKYGYDSEDYRKSVDHYMNDPERFSKILRETGEILDARLLELSKRKGELERLNRKKAEMEKYRPDLKLKEYFPYLHGKSYVQYFDSLTVETDDMNVYRLKPVSTADTLFDGVRIIVSEPDTLSVDTLAVEAVADTVKVKLPSLLKDTVRFRSDINRSRTRKLIDKNNVYK